MAMKSIESFKQSRGAVAPLVAIMLILIVVCVALVVDLGHIHNVKVELQRAVDAAALAGAQHLNGNANQVTNAKNVAIATAVANGVLETEVTFVDDAACTTSDADSCLGTWDPDALGSAASTRFTQTEISPNAVLVRVQRNVPHAFFFFLPGGSDVTADAIAVATPEVPVLPLAIITCIPAEQMLENPGSLPDMTVCGIAPFKFTNDADDTVAWTSLTYNPDAVDIKEFMEYPDGVEKFNKVIFGRGLTNTDGIENQSVDTGISSPYSAAYPGCPSVFPYGEIIPCGLGKIAGKDIATRADFESIAPTTPDLTQGLQGVFQANLPFDPLTAYGINGSNSALPRWYNINSDNPDFDKDDHFTRIWSQDGVLLRGSEETYSDYVARIASYATCPDVGVSSCNPYGDDRFKIIGNNENFIVEPAGQFRNNLSAVIGFPPSHWPDFRKVIKHAGYPKVGIINGAVVDVIATFLENPLVTDGTNLRCSDNDPFPVGEKTLRVNSPVIFAGACEDWKAISNPSPVQGFTYIGLARTLITRVWPRGAAADFDCGNDNEVVQLPSGGVDCSASDFNPGLRGGISFSLPAESPNAPANFMAIEGLTLVPVADDEEAHASLLKVFLVE
jgi:Flp pilus assembly protein TadG